MVTKIRQYGNLILTAKCENRVVTSILDTRGRSVSRMQQLSCNKHLVRVAMALYVGAHLLQTSRDIQNGKGWSL